MYFLFLCLEYYFYYLFGIYQNYTVQLGLLLAIRGIFRPRLQEFPHIPLWTTLICVGTDTDSSKFNLLNLRKELLVKSLLRELTLLTLFWIRCGCEVRKLASLEENDCYGTDLKNPMIGKSSGKFRTFRGEKKK